MSDTIYALSSGSPPAAIAVVRISGREADAALFALCGRLPEPRRASLAPLRDPATGELLDNALVFRFVGPATATGESMAELHLHGGRAVVAAVLAAVGRIPGLREAQAGEFTRRAFGNGRMDLAEAEGLADLLMAETQSQRRAALTLAGGSLSRLVEKWQEALLALAAQIEATIDFSDEGDVQDAVSLAATPALDKLILEIDAALAGPTAERLRDGVRVVIAGPPNAGKSSLINLLSGRQAAIISPIAGTTRDLIEAPTAIGGTPFLLIDTAGLRDATDEVEAIGVERARTVLDTADLILWLGEPADCPDRERSIIIQSKADLESSSEKPDVDLRVSALTGEGLDDMVAMLIDRSRASLPQEGEVATNRRQRELLRRCVGYLREAKAAHDLIIASELLRQARAALDVITGRAGVEDMLDALFGRFCIGK